MSFRIERGLAKVLLGFWICVPAYAQSYAVVGPARQVNPPGSGWRECCVGARLSNPNEVVVAAIDNATTRTAFGVSLNGGLSFTNDLILTLGLDPWVTVDPVTDRIWITALGYGQLACDGRCIGNAWKQPGATSFNWGCTVVQSNSAFLDKPAMSIASDGRHYVTFLGRGLDDDNADHPAWSARTLAPLSCTWDTDRIEPSDDYSGHEWEGWGSLLVILSTGRIVVATRDEKKLGQQYQWEYNGGLPHVAYSDAPNPELDWKPDAPEPILVAEGSQIQATQIQVRDDDDPFFRGDSPYIVDNRQCAPAIAADPESDYVYVAFYARHLPGSFDSNLNTDIYISRSTDGGTTFPGQQGDLNLFPLTDELLTGIPGGEQGPDQMMPSICIDTCGGVNVVFYDNRNDPELGDDEHWLDLYYVRITGYGTPQQAIQQVRLTPESFTIQTIGTGDYRNMVAVPPTMGTLTPTIYPAYIAIARDAGGSWTLHNCYVHKITIYCLGDMNLNGELDDEDVVLFAEAFAAERAEADLTGDNCIDAADEKLFWDVRAKGCDSR